MLTLYVLGVCLDVLSCQRYHGNDIGYLNVILNIFLFGPSKQTNSYHISGFQGFIGDYIFKSKTHQDDCCPDGLCKAAMYALFVNEELDSWPEQITRKRSWLTIAEAVESCRHKWMEEALKDFSSWLAHEM